MGKLELEGGEGWGWIGALLGLAAMMCSFGLLGLAVKFAWHAWTTGW